MDSERKLSTTGQPDESNRLQPTRGIASDFQAIECVPTDPAERARLSTALGGNLQLWLEDRLSGGDRKLLRQFGFHPPVEDDRRRLQAAFDELIAEQAGRLGPLLFLSDSVLNRMIQWYQFEENGPELLQRLDQELVRGAQVRRGQSRRLLKDPRLPGFRKNIVRELKMIQRKLNAMLATCHRRLKDHELRKLVEDELTQPAQVYEQVAAQRTGFLRYLAQNPLQTRSWLVTLEMTSTQIAYGWIAWAEGYKDPQSARKAISRLGSQKKLR